MPRRRWNEWPRRFAAATNDINGVAGLVGLGIVAIGSTVSVPVVTTVGGVTFLASLLFAAWRGIPPKLSLPTELVGKTIPISDLENVDPSIIKLGIVGYTQSGKTTFLKQALHLESSNTRTSKINATILALQTPQSIYVALLDGDGKEFSQQFDIAKAVDLLLVFLDHNEGNENIAKSKNRLLEHDRFMEQLILHLRRRGALKHLYLVMNKRDLWEKSKFSKDLQKWFADHVARLKMANVASDITADVHSNLNATDIGNVMRRIGQEVTK